MKKNRTRTEQKAVAEERWDADNEFMWNTIYISYHTDFEYVFSSQLTNILKIIDHETTILWRLMFLIIDWKIEYQLISRSTSVQTTMNYFPSFVFN